MSVLFFTKGDKAVASSRHRVWFVAERLGYSYKIIYPQGGRFPGTRGLLQDIWYNDVIFVHKSLFPWKVVVLILLGKIFLRKRVIYDLDDAEWIHSPLKSFLLAHFANVVFCGSHAILEWAKRKNSKSKLIPTVVDHEIYARYKIEHKKRDIYTIGWVGAGKGHFLDGHFAMIRPALDEVAKSTKFRFVIVGSQKFQPLKDYFVGSKFEVIFVDELDWHDPESVPRAIYRYSFDVGLMPTSDTPFNRAKCAFKAIEYMACGVPVIVSPVGENTIVVQDGVSGFFARDVADWVETIKKLFSDANLRDRFGQVGLSIIEKKYSYTNILSKFQEILEPSHLPRSKRFILKNIAINCSILIITGLVLFLLTELTFRLWFPQSYDPFLYDPVIGSRVQPGTFVNIIDGKAHYKTANSAGFVDDEWSLEKPLGVKRITILGDSFTEAIQVDDDKDFESLLEKKFKDAGQKVEVMNFGIRGQSTVQEYLTLKKYALSYEPDIILVAAFFFNDVSDNTPDLRSTTRPFITFNDGVEKFIRPKDPTRGFPFNYLGDHFHFYRWAVKEYFLVKSNVKKIVSKIGNRVPAQYSTSTIPYFAVYNPWQQKKPEWREAWNITEEMFRRIQTLARENNAKLLVFMIPVRYEVYSHDFETELAKYPGTPSHDYNLQLTRKRGKEMFQKLSIPFVDLYPTFRIHADMGEKLYLLTDSHFNELGHEVVANMLFQALNGY